VRLRARLWLFLREDPEPAASAVESIPAGLLTSGRFIPTGRHCHRENPRTGPGGKPHESWWVPRGVRLPARVLVPCSVVCPASLRSGRRSAGRTGPGNRIRAARGSLWRGAKTPMRASACAGRGPRQVRISVESKALELRGIVNSWSSEQEHAMPETARGHRRRKAYGSIEGKRSAG
jgi:hypothetical protein